MRQLVSRARFRPSALLSSIIVQAFSASAFATMASCCLQKLAWCPGVGVDTVQLECVVMRILHVPDGKIERKIRAPGVQLAPALIEIVPDKVDAELVPFALAHLDAAFVCAAVGEDVGCRPGRRVVAHHA
ncbi:hypothetical protein NDY24_09975 [Xanthomonas hortorum pv. pelargonii]|nr:hypothetical protein NDY24_09975 [Xanthomonas hortorum pv. pelargonii]